VLGLGLLRADGQARCRALSACGKPVKCDAAAQAGAMNIRDKLRCPRVSALAFLSGQ
jgi:hypothetical protein